MTWIKIRFRAWRLRRQGFRTAIKWEYGKALLYVYTSIGIFKDVLVF